MYALLACGIGALSSLLMLAAAKGMHLERLHTRGKEGVVVALWVCALGRVGLFACDGLAERRPGPEATKRGASATLTGCRPQIRGWTPNHHGCAGMRSPTPARRHAPHEQAVANRTSAR